MKHIAQFIFGALFSFDPFNVLYVNGMNVKFFLKKEKKTRTEQNLTWMRHAKKKKHREKENNPRE